MLYNRYKISFSNDSKKFQAQTKLTLSQIQTQPNFALFKLSIQNKILKRNSKFI